MWYPAIMDWAHAKAASLGRAFSGGVTGLALIGAAFAALSLGACKSSDGACKDDFDCDGSLVCVANTGTCEPFVCKSNNDCAGTLSCEDNACK